MELNQYERDAAQSIGDNEARKQLSAMNLKVPWLEALIVDQEETIQILRRELIEKNDRLYALEGCIPGSLVQASVCEHSLDDCQHGTDVFWDSITQEKEGAKERALPSPPEHNPFAVQPTDRRRLGQ